MKFRTRLVLAATVAVLFAVVLSAVAAYLAARSSLESTLDATLRQTANAVANSGGQNTAPGDLVQTWSPAGFIEPGTLPVTPEVRAVAADNAPAYYTDVKVNGEEWRELVTPIHALDDQTILSAALQVATPLAQVNHQLSRLQLVLVVVVGSGIALAVILGLLVARTALVPLDDLSSVVEDLAETTDVSRRLDPGVPDELGRLRSAFNRLLHALQTSQDAQQQLVLDASHELRTPLTSLRTNLEVARRLEELPPEDRQVLVDDVLTQLDELTDIVGNLAELTRGEQRPSEPTSLRLDRVVDEAVAVATTHGRSRNITFELSSRPTWVIAQRERIARAVWNLLDNALKWSPAGGVVHVRCEGGQIEVRDHGPGIPPEDLPLVFGRFYRAPAARALPGSGLGLAIVAQVAAESGGLATAANAEDGGAIVRITLPVVFESTDEPAIG